MANPNPTKARQARKRRRKPGDVKAVLGKVWSALETAESDLGSQIPEIRLKAAHAVFQGATAYTKLLELGEHESRLRAVEEKLGLRQ